MPDSSDLDAPDGFVARVLGAGEAGNFDDPIAQLEAVVAKERAAEEAMDKTREDDEEK
jgi:hypothetical protein